MCAHRYKDQRLVQADQLLVAAEMRLTRHLLMIERRRRAGLPGKTPDRLLRLLKSRVRKCEQWRAAVWEDLFAVP